MRKLFAGVSVALTLAGCANLNSVFRDRTMLYDGAAGVANVVTVDAKQRAVISSLQPDVSGGNARVARICSEPPPDVMSTINSSLSAALSGTLAPTEKTAALNLATAMVEQAAEIQRSQSMNLLALSMYRTCERFLNGAISAETASDQAIRDQRTMVTVLAIEQLTNLGQNVSKGAILSGGQASGAGSVGSASNGEILGHAKDTADASAKAYADAAKTLADDLAAATPAAGKSPACSDLPSEKQQSCLADQSSVDKLKTSSVRDEAYYQAQLKLATAANLSSSSSSSGGTAAASQRGESAKLSDAAIKTISDAVLDLAKLGVSEDPLSSVCASVIRSHTITETNFQAIADECTQAKKLAGNSGSLSVAFDTARFGSLGTDEGPSPRLYVQISDAAQVRAVDAINATVRQSFPEVDIRAYQLVDQDKVPRASDIRYFNPGDAKAAAALSQRLAAAFGGVGPRCNQRASKTVRPGLLELWIAHDQQINVGGLAATGGQPGPGCQL